MKIGFYNEQLFAGEVDFGCLTQGFTDASCNVKALDNLEGESFFGSYADALAFAQEYKDSAKAAILLLDGAGDEDRFVQEISALLSCPVAGGVAARTFGRTGDGLSAGKGDAALCILTGDNITCAAETRNLHTNIVEECELTLDGPRYVSAINGEDAVTFLRRKREELGFAPDDFERVTLSTKDHVNAHMSLVNEKIYSGRNMEKSMLLRSVVPDTFQSSIEQFYQEQERALLFGCAGLKRVVSRQFPSDCAGSFLHGEIVALDGRSEFANLMLCRLTVEAE